MKIFHAILLLAALLMSRYVLAQNQGKPFYDEILAFKQEDSLHKPPAGAVLFTGSSSIRKWTNVQEMFPGYTVLNRGFGGSTMPDVIRYVDDVIFPYNPRQVVIYCGENDIATGTVTATEVADNFKKLFGMIRQRLPAASVVFISIKPSPSREKFLPVVRQANQMIRNFLKQQRNVSYVDVYSKMLDAKGKPVPSLFGEDMLHMNQEGYKIWHGALLPYLKK